MSTSKRRPIPKKPPSTPLSAQNPFRFAWGAAGVVLILIVSVPMFLDAAHGQSITESPLGTETTALIGALGSLGTQIDHLKTDIVNLRNQLSSGGTTTGGTTAPQLGEGVPECLQACRTRLSSCLKLQATSTATGIAGITPTGALDTCRTQANDCVNRCRPRTTPSVSCEDRCAVALGGCVSAAETSPVKLDECRLQNRRCLIAACRPGSDAGAVNRIPPEICRDQCTRDLTVCRKAARFDSQALEACELVARRCLGIICGASSGTTAPGQEVTVQCENNCTAEFASCRVSAGNDANVLAECDGKYGSCREACLVSIGGTPFGSQP